MTLQYKYELIFMTFQKKPVTPSLESPALIIFNV